MTTSRRNFLAALFGFGMDGALNKGGVTNFLLETIADFSVKEVEAAKPTASATKPEQKSIDDIAITLQKGENFLNNNQYKQSYEKFTRAYNKSETSLQETNNDQFYLLKIAALMYRSAALVKSPSNIIEGAQSGTISNHKTALDLYTQALELRLKRSGIGYAVRTSHGKEILIADERLIRKRLTQVYEQLMDFVEPSKDPTKDPKMRGARKNAFENYKHQLIFNYQRLLETEPDDSDCIPILSRLINLTPNPALKTQYERRLSLLAKKHNPYK